MTSIAPTDALPMWVIYQNPSDIPGKFVVRRHWVGNGISYHDQEPTAVANSLAEARAAVPMGACNINRFPADDPQIVEVWI